ncbi:MAG: DNA-formamidopyrimidine glycosylase [Candidatus Acetothermia bacterium]|jgi:formamidopyrimidine-DNA glycosylase|nr:DNA-formamidopyrimidine glycosylase [Candidatus Acetothermia bacterium]MDH7505777.1 DNA-formamidopyrimidine glycosylase [Candidatus Acetothermia bacterium]
MPELPEVETIKRSLEREVLGKEIAGVEVRRPSLLQGLSLKELEARTVGAKILGIRRRGKHLIFDLDSHYSLVFHLGLEELFLLKEQDARAISLVLHFADGKRLYLEDARGSGRLFLAPTEQVERLPSLAKLGLEPFTPNYTWGRFEKLMRTNQEIKRLLLDQAKIAGVGNIYASEVLYRCRVHPRQLANELTLSEARCLFDEIQKIMEEAIAHRGSSAGHFLDIDGTKGEFQAFLKVYGRAGQPCERCGTPVEEMEAGRGTFFCPKCQPLKAPAKHDLGMEDLLI